MNSISESTVSGESKNLKMDTHGQPKPTPQLAEFLALVGREMARGWIQCHESANASNLELPANRV